MNTENKIQFVFSLLPHVTIMNHVPGRIRLRFTREGLRVLAGLDGEGLDVVVPGIRKAKFFWLSKSAVLRYDPLRLPFDFWESLFQTKDNPSLAPEVRSRLKGLLEAKNERGTPL